MKARMLMLLALLMPSITASASERNRTGTDLQTRGSVLVPLPEVATTNPPAMAAISSPVEAVSGKVLDHDALTRTLDGTVPSAYLFVPEPDLSVLESSIRVAGWFREANRDNSWKENPEDPFATFVTSGINKCHMAEDWNGIGGMDTDLGWDIKALSDGEVVARGYAGDVGKYILVDYNLPNGETVRTASYHCDSQIFFVGERTTNRDIIATVGNTGSAATYAHHHLEARKNLSLSHTENPYYGPLKLSTYVEDYTSPTTLVWERRTGTAAELGLDRWNFFTTGEWAPTANAFITVEQGAGLESHLSLRQAAQANFISRWMAVWRDLEWQYFNILDDELGETVFREGELWAIAVYRPTVESIHLNIPYLYGGGSETEMNNVRRDRACLDMFHEVYEDPRFSDGEIAESFVYRGEEEFEPCVIGSDTSVWNRHVGIAIANDGTRVSVNQLEQKGIPTNRWVNYQDPVTREFVGWTQVDPNQFR